MKALFVSTVSVTLRTFLSPISVHFRNRGWLVDAMAAGAPNCTICRETFDHVFDVDWSRNPLNFPRLFKSVRQITKVVGQKDYDIVHVHTPVAAFVTRMALRRARKIGGPKVIYTAHGFHFHRGGTVLKNTIFLNLEKLAGRWTDYLVVINHEDEEMAKKHSIVAPKCVFYMPGIGVDTKVYDPSNVPSEDVALVRAELGLSPNDVLVLMIAEFNPGKRHRDALRAFAALDSNLAHLAFAGEGRLRAEMEKLAQDLGVYKRVHFLGHRKDIHALIRASAATLLPSEREGLPRSIMESLCLEVPAIGTDVRGIRDLIGNDCGLIVPVGDTHALAKALAFVLEHPDKAAVMGHSGRQKMFSYDINQILKLHEELYAKASTNT